MHVDELTAHRPSFTSCSWLFLSFGSTLLCHSCSCSLISYSQQAPMCRAFTSFKHTCTCCCKVPNCSYVVHSRTTGGRAWADYIVTIAQLHGFCTWYDPAVLVMSPHYIWLNIKQLTQRHCSSVSCLCQSLQKWAQNSNTVSPSVVSPQILLLPSIYAWFHTGAVASCQATTATVSVSSIHLYHVSVHSPTFLHRKSSWQTSSSSPCCWQSRTWTISIHFFQEHFRVYTDFGKYAKQCERCGSYSVGSIR